MPPTPLAFLSCHQCNYDLRAHPPDGRCPECGASVAESQRLSAIPRRPRWRDSDPRWRRRMLAGVWILVFLPLLSVLTTLDWASSVPVPTVLSVRGSVRTLDDTFANDRNVYPSLIFCIGMVLLFSKERNRRAGRLDWTRRWGVLCSYVVFLLSAVEVLFISALLLCGVAAELYSMPAKYQPAMTQFFIRVSAGYLSHGPYPGTGAFVALIAFSSITVLLACIPLLDALRASGSRRLAAILLAPLAIFALLYLAQAARYCLSSSSASSSHFSHYAIYFWPEPLAQPLADRSAIPSLLVAEVSDVVMEDIKWCIMFTIAVWLTAAQLAAPRHREKAISG